MKPSIIYLSVFGILLFCAPHVLGDAKTPLEGGALSDILLPMPENPDHRKYLGVKEKSTFSIPEINAEIVIIEIFSMYCPHCQREAKTVNDFYLKIENNSKLKNRVKLIGIGVGNSKFEVEVFKKKYSIPFPLFPDPDFSIHKKTGEVRTPYFIGVKIEGNNKYKVFYSQLGGPKDARLFLDKLLESSGLL